MNIPNDIKLKLEKVSPQKFSDFLGGNGIPILTCGVCHKIGMIVPQVQVMQTIVVSDKTTLTERELEPKKYTYIDYVCIKPESSSSLLSYEYRIICKSCGFASHFSVLPVINWIEAQENEQTDKEMD